MPSDAGSHSGNANLVSSETLSYNLDGSVNTNKKNYNGSNSVRSCVLGYKTGTFTPGASNNTQEYKGESATLKSFQITNKDLEIRQLWRLIASPEDSAVKSAAWWNFLFANAYNYATFINPVGFAALAPDFTAQTALLETYFANVLCLPTQMMTSLTGIMDKDESDPAAVTIAQKRSVLYWLTRNITASVVVPTFPDFQVKLANPPSGTFVNPWTHDFTVWVDDAGTLIPSTTVYPSILSTVPNIVNVEDESDLQFIFKVITCVMNNVRSCQLNNDREQEVVDFVNEVAECNEAFHQDVFTDMTAIDESELCQRYVVGKELCTDLDSLYKENCVSKQSFFNDITLTNICW